jgi:DNA-binding LacI/PurR family transcriptional regulator
VKPGEDVAVVSCNNERSLVAGLWPALTTIDAHLSRVGRLAVEQLTRRITGEFDGAAVDITVTPTLVPEASLAPRHPTFPLEAHA